MIATSGATQVFLVVAQGYQCVEDNILAPGQNPEPRVMRVRV